MKKTVLIFILVFTLLLCSFGCTAIDYGKEIIVGGDFNFLDTEDLGKTWYLESGNEDDYSAPFTISDETVKINTTDAGWAYMSQELKLNNNSYYKITYTYEATTMTKVNDKFVGLYVGFLEDDNFNRVSTDVLEPTEQRTATVSKATGEIYFHTDNTTVATLAIFVGTKDYPVKTTVTIDNISLVKVKKNAVPTVVNPQTQATELSVWNLKADIFGANSINNIVYVILGGVGTILLAYAAYILFRRHLYKEDSYKNAFLLKLKDSKWLGFTIAVASAFIVRFVLVLTMSLLAAQSNTAFLGYSVEADATKALYMGNYGTIWVSEQLAEFGTQNGYVMGKLAPTPIYSYLLALVGAIAKGAANPVLIATVLIKIIACLADVAAVYVLYKMLENKIGRIGSTLMCVLYALIPMVFSASAIWGLSESIMGFLIILLFSFVLKNNYVGVAVTYFIAFMVSITALFLAPLLIFYAVRQFIYRKELRIFIIVSFVASLILYYLFTLPFCYNSIANGKAFACVTEYYNAIMGNNLYTLNAFNFQALLSNNYKEITTESTFITIIFIVFILALVGVGYFRSKNRMDLMLLSGLTVCMLFTFVNRMNPISMYIALIILFAYAAVNKEKRVFFIFTMYALFMFVNTSYVYMVGGYTVEGIKALSYGGNAIIYVFSALNLVLTGYFVYVAYDIVVVKKAARIKPMELTYIGSVVNTGRKIMRFFQKLKLKLAK